MQYEDFQIAYPLGYIMNHKIAHLHIIEGHLHPHPETYLALRVANIKLGVRL